MKYLLHGEITREKIFANNLVTIMKQDITKLAECIIKSYNNVTKTMEEVQICFESRTSLVGLQEKRWPRTDNFLLIYDEQFKLEFYHNNPANSRRRVLSFHANKARNAETEPVYFGTNPMTHDKIMIRFCQVKLDVFYPDLKSKNIVVAAGATVTTALGIASRTHVHRETFRECIFQFQKNCTVFRHHMIIFMNDYLGVLYEDEACDRYAQFLDHYSGICREFIFVTYGGLVCPEFNTGLRVDNNNFIYHYDLDAFEKTVVKVQVVSCCVEGLQHLFMQHVSSLFH